MDVERSESAHQAVPIGPVKMIVHQDATEISIETQKAETPTSQPVSEKLVFLLNGAERTNLAATGQTVKARAHWDGPKLVAETEREINGSTVTTTQVFQLGNSGRELTVDKLLAVQHGYQSPGANRTTGSGKDVFVKTTK